MFKTREEKLIEEDMRREEQMEVFSSQIKELKQKRDEYAKIAAEAELNNDIGTYDVAVNNLLELNDVVSSLMQTKANFDIINVSNATAANMAMAVNALSKMASNGAHLPNLRKIRKVNVQVARYMRRLKISNKAMGQMMGKVNPANNTVRTEAEIASVRPLIDAARSKMNVMTNNPVAFDLSSEIEAEKSRGII